MSYKMSNSMCEICGKNRTNHNMIEKEVCSAKRKEQHKDAKRRKPVAKRYQGEKLEQFLKIYD